MLAGLVARMREQRNAYKVWIRKPEIKKPPGRYKRVGE